MIVMSWLLWSVIVVDMYRDIFNAAAAIVASNADNEHMDASAGCARY